MKRLKSQQAEISSSNFALQCGALLCPVQTAQVSCLRYSGLGPRLWDLALSKQ